MNRLAQTFFSMVGKLPSPLQVPAFFVSRPIIWMLPKLDTEREVLAPVGPAYCRFKMRLNWTLYVDQVLGLYEPGVARALRQYVQPGSCCLDVGAHLGYYTILMARLTGRDGLVVAFEPFPENVTALQENLRLNGVENVRLEECALAGRSGNLELTYPTNEAMPSTPSAHGYKVGKAMATVTVPARTLDDALAQVKSVGRNPQLVKMDIEGAELEVLQGAEHLLRDVRPILVVEVHGWRAGLGEAIQALLAQARYEVKLLGFRWDEAFCLATPK